ncbi:class I SAM-dependent methyltransferase [Streptomyces sp. CA-111067]|uniref:class I SAM-dependent methyltransferase n=1 Tax=Streptomyces sp. CA-111067 TaxID=3240046 RepID=UPI003D99F071
MGDVNHAAVYDVVNPWGRAPDDAFYLSRVMAARAVLDVGCGTGMLLRQARASGHQGRLCGLDPDDAMLARARESSAGAGIDWVLGDLGSASWQGEFDLVVMTGHAFQELRTDEELRGSLRAIHTALTEDGRFVFETRNPAARAWLRWTPEHARESVDPATGATVRTAHQVQLPPDGDLVTFTTTVTSTDWAAPATGRSTLRFLDAPALAAHLADAGLTVLAQYGDWDGSPLTEASPEIITTVAR